jgi:hypothetical protein
MREYLLRTTFSACIEKLLLLLNDESLVKLNASVSTLHVSKTTSKDVVEGDIILETLPSTTKETKPPIKTFTLCDTSQLLLIKSESFIILLAFFFLYFSPVNQELWYVLMI